MLRLARDWYRLVGIIGALAAILAGCDSSVVTASASPPIPSLAGCPITVPNGRTPPGEEPNPFHHGNGKLYTVLYEAVIGTPDNTAPDGSIDQKFPWWRADGVVGRLQVEGSRIDGSAAPLGTDFQDYGETAFQATTLVFPTIGCWQITARAGDAELTVVQQVVVGPQASPGQ